jgi:SAM-dependent methyltransferase
VGEVYCIEAIPERIEFTQERLLQEGIRNVRLIQASATQMPLMDNTFDLVVTNGVLEWVGEWDLEGTPRDVQVRFLSKICRLLKDDGVLVIGIENRFGYGMLLGGNDHSGIPYTSLVPRPVADFMLRHSSTPHHRTRLNPKKEYRTYTYSQRGYRKLLTDAGFRESSCYWAQPGYNQPYHLIPLAKPQWSQERWLDLLDHPGPGVRRSWARRIKRLIGRSPLLPLIVPDFVLFASKLNRKTKVQSWVKERLNGSGNTIEDRPTEPKLNWALATHPFGDESVARLENPAEGRDLYIKIKVAANGGAASFATELLNRAKIRNSLEASANRAVGVPEVHATLIDGNISYLMESGCGGKQVSRIIRRLGYYEDEQRVENDFANIVARVIEFTEAVKDVPVNALDSEWYTIPEELKNLLHGHNGMEKARYFLGSSVGSRTTWTQHGDLSIENVFFDQQTGRLEVIDWGDVAAGFPPLYDLFNFFASSGYLTPAEEALRFRSEEERCITSFRAVFFGDTSFTSVVRELVLQACERLKVQPELIPVLLVEFLLVRVHYYRKKSAFQHRVHLRLLQLCLEPNQHVFGRFPLFTEPLPPGILGRRT